MGVVAFSPDGQWVATGGGDGTARVWAVATGEEVARIEHEDAVQLVAFSPDGRWVVSGCCGLMGRSGELRVWEAATGREVSRKEHETKEGIPPTWGVVTAVSFGPDGTWLVSGSWDHTVQVWQASTGQEIHRMLHEGAVEDVDLAWGGGWIASASGDRTARIWETATGREVARMEHEGGVGLVAFNPDGRRAASGSDDDTVRVWWWRPEDLIAEACARMTRNLTFEEWQQYLPDEPCRATCPNLPDRCTPSSTTP